MKNLIGKVATFIANLFESAPMIKAFVLNAVTLAVAKLGFHATNAELLGVVTAGMALWHALAALGIMQAKANTAAKAVKADAEAHKAEHVAP